eukprot:gene8524-10479_t
MEKERKRVVVVGGGYGGVYLSKLLDDKFDVTLIERKQLFFHNITALRLVVEPDLCKKVFIPMDRLLKKGRVIHKLAVEIKPTGVKLDDGTEIAFDYLVIATGSNNMTPYKSPVDTTNLYPYYKELREKVKEAKSVAIIGGTTIGCELAGEIVTQFPGKPVTLVQHIGRLCSHRLGEKFSDKLGKKLMKAGVKVMLNTVVDIPPEAVSDRNNSNCVNYQLKPQTINTDNGDIDADLVFWCLGNRPNSEALRANFSEVIDHMGYMKVNEHMQVEGFQNIFAIGDITNVSELKTAYNALFHAIVVSKNISAIEHKKSLSKHTPTYPMLFISIGKNKGVSNIPGGIVAGSFVTKFIKSKHTYVSYCRKLLNNPKTEPNIGQ